LQPVPLAADPTCSRSHLQPIPLAADPTCSRSHLRPISLAADPTYWTAIAFALTPSGSPHSSVRYRLVVVDGVMWRQYAVEVQSARAHSLRYGTYFFSTFVDMMEHKVCNAARTPRSALSLSQRALPLLHLLCSLRTRRAGPHWPLS
jgi:hypothetical protein